LASGAVEQPGRIMEGTDQCLGGPQARYRVVKNKKVVKRRAGAIPFGGGGKVTEAVQLSCSRPGNWVGGRCITVDERCNTVDERCNTVARRCILAGGRCITVGGRCVSLPCTYPAPNLKPPLLQWTGAELQWTSAVLQWTSAVLQCVSAVSQCVSAVSQWLDAGGATLYLSQSLPALTVSRCCGTVGARCISVSRRRSTAGKHCIKLPCTPP
jgi:hypothetical protein